MAAHPTHAIPELDAAGLRRFAITTGGIVIVLFGLALPWLLDLGWPRWPWVLGIVLAGWGLAAPASLRPVYRGWMRFGLLLNRVTTPIILGAVFYLMFAPVALVMRVIGRDTMSRRRDADATTYRVPSTNRGKDSLERPY